MIENQAIEPKNATPAGTPAEPIARGLAEIQAEFSKQVSVYGGIQFQIKDLQEKLPEVERKLVCLREEFQLFVAAQNEKAKPTEPVAS